MRVSDRAIQVHGGRGLLAETGLERIYRVARNLRIPAGTTEIQRAMIAESLAAARMAATGTGRRSGPQGLDVGRKAGGRGHRRGARAQEERAVGGVQQHGHHVRARRAAPSMPSAQSSSPKRSTRSARTPGPASDEADRVPGVDDLGRRRRRMVAGDAHDRVAEALAEIRRARRRRPRSCVAFGAGPWCGRPRRWPSGGRRRTWRRRPGPPGPARAAAQGAGRVGAPRRSARTAGRPSPPGRRGRATPPIEAPSTPCRARKLGAGRGRPHHLSVTAPSAAGPAGGGRCRPGARERAQRHAAPELGRTRRRRRLGNQRPGAQDREAVAEEGIRVRDRRRGAPPVIRSTPSPPLRHEGAQLHREPAGRAPRDALQEGPRVAASPGPARPVTQSGPPSRARRLGGPRGRATSPAPGACPWPRASRTARPGNSAGG